MDHVAGAEAPVRIEGEPGTGRTLVARTLHRLSSRRRAELYVLDARRADDARGGRFLFGVDDRDGLVWSARGATLLVRYAERLDPEAQSLLVRWLHERRIPVGPHRGEESDARLLVTTEGGSRGPGALTPEFAAALAALRVHIPPLRERGDDAAVLFVHFLRGAGQPPGPLDAGTRRLLASQPWRGNVPEVRALARLVVSRGPFASLTEADLLPLLAFPRPRRAAPGALDGVPTLADVSIGHIVRVLALAGGVRTRAAKALGISPRTLYNQLRALKETGGPRIQP